MYLNWDQQIASYSSSFLSNSHISKCTNLKKSYNNLNSFQGPQHQKTFKPAPSSPPPPSQGPPPTYRCLNFILFLQDVPKTKIVVSLTAVSKKHGFTW